MTWLAAKKYFRFSKKFTYTILNYDLELNIAPRRHTYLASASVTMEITKNTRQFLFLLSDQCSLNSISYLGLSLFNKVKPAYPGLNLITTTLPRRADEGEKLVLVFTYTGDIPAPLGETMELDPSLHWYPFGLGFQRYTCTLNVITPNSIRIIGSGHLTKEQPTDTRVLTQWTAPSPFWGIHMLAGEFLKTTRDIQPSLEVYYPRKYMNQGKKVADNCEKLLTYYLEKLGPAPTSTAVVLTDSTNPDTKTSPFVTSISGAYLDQLRNCKSSKERNMRLFLLNAREMARRWLKCNLAVTHPSHYWYLDGLAEYLSWLALEEEYGSPFREQVMQEARVLVLAEARKAITQEAYGIRNEFAPWLVAKASWLMRMAHHLAGDSLLPALQEFYTQVSQTQLAPPPQEFYRILGYLTGADLDQLYSEWALSSKKLLAVVAQARTFQDEQGQWQLIFNLENQGKLNWPHPVEIKMDLADGSTQTHKLYIQKEPHLIVTEAKISTLTVDPDLMLLNSAQEKTYNM